MGLKILSCMANEATWMSSEPLPIMHVATSSKRFQLCLTVCYGENTEILEKYAHNAYRECIGMLPKFAHRHLFHYL